MLASPPRGSCRVWGDTCGRGKGTRVDGAHPPVIHGGLGTSAKIIQVPELPWITGALSMTRAAGGRCRSPELHARVVKKEAAAGSGTGQVPADEGELPERGVLPEGDVVPARTQILIRTGYHLQEGFDAR